jgi:glycosyltransferase involved in cell wall biosynthesis
LKKCDLLFVHQGIDITMAADALGVDESKISVIEHGLFEEDCEPPRLDEKKLLLLGTLSPYKGVAEMVEAMKKLPEFHLSIYGRSGDDAYIEKCQEASGQNVSWHVGFVPDEDIAKAYSLSTVAVFPYREFNAQSGALHLALGSGRPVLTTDAGGIATVVRKFNCGVVAEDSTPEALVRALRWLFDPVNLARSLEGVERARGALSWKVAAQQSLSAIEKVDAIHGK